MDEELLHRLITIAQDTAPELWRIAGQQIQVDIVRTIISILINLVVIVGLCVLARMCYKWHCGCTDNRHYGDEWLAGRAFVLLLTAADVFIVLPSFVYKLIQLVMNPEYEMIVILMTIIKG